MGTAVDGTERAALDGLVVEVATGDHDAFARLYDAVAPTVFGICRRVLIDVDQAEEVTQEVMLEVWRTAARYDPGRGSATAWIAVAAHRRAVDRVHSSQSSRNREERARRDALPRQRPTLGRRGLALAAALLVGLAVVTFASLQGAPAPVEQVRIAAEQGTDDEIERLLARFSDELTVDSVVTEAGATARVVRGGDSAVLLTDGLPALADSQTYQAWLIDADGPTSAGVLGAGAERSRRPDG